MKALSLDLRHRVSEAIDHDTLASYQDIAQRFAVSVSSVERLTRKKREGQSLAPGVGTGRKTKVAPEQVPSFEQLAASRTDWTLRSLSEAWQQQGGQSLSLSATQRTLQRIGFTFKKSAASPKKETKPSGKPSGKQ